MIDDMLLEYTIRIVLSLICGFLLGIERKSHMNPVGIRTLVLISISCCSLSILSVYMSNLGTHSGDPTRIASTAVTGIGFIGGGTVLRQGATVSGLTTAATLWVAAAIGMACGCEYYSLAVVVSILTVVILVLIN